jgi:hypothetical protein
MSEPEMTLEQAMAALAEMAPLAEIGKLAVAWHQAEVEYLLVEQKWSYRLCARAEVDDTFRKFGEIRGAMMALVAAAEEWCVKNGVW